MDAVDASCFQHVEADHSVVIHDDGMVGLDEAHAAHVRRQVEHMLHALGDGQAVVHDAEIHQMELVTEHVLTHVLILLPIRCHDVVTLGLQASGNVRGDESASSCDGNPQLLLRPVWLPLQITGSVLPVYYFLHSIARHSCSLFELAKTTPGCSAAEKSAKKRPNPRRRRQQHKQPQQQQQGNPVDERKQQRQQKALLACALFASVFPSAAASELPQLLMLEKMNDEHPIGLPLQG